MQYAEVLVDAQTTRGSFYYSIPPALFADIRRGSFVRVPFRQREIDGIVIDISNRLPRGLSIEKIRPVKDLVWGRSILPASLLSLAIWMTDHYLCSLADAVFTIVPPFPKKRQLDLAPSEEKQADKYGKYYVNGRELMRWDTYRSAIKKTLAQEKQVVALFPSTAQAKRFLSSIQPITTNSILYSADFPRAKRFRVWSRIASGGVDVVVGTRLAVFAPSPTLGLIIIDDETHPGHQESQHPRYHAREVAAARARLSGATLISGGELPSLSTFAEIRQGAIRRIDIPEALPNSIVIDIRTQKNVLSPTIEDALASHRKGIIIATKLGEGAATRCRDCGHLFRCPNCEMPLTLHAGNALRCHHCGHSESLTSACPSCHGTSFRRVGIGAERLEKYICERFPGRKVTRLEANRPLPHRWDYLISTIKLLDTTITAPVVAISSLDTILELPDPFAVERVAQLLVQLRSRSEKEFLIQTRLPDHPVFQVFCHPDYFLAEELAKRQSKRYPPAVTLIRLLLAGPDRVKITARLAKLGGVLKTELSPKFVSVLGPGPAFYEKLKGQYRWHLLLKLSGNDRKTSQKLRLLIPNNIQVDVNPIDLL